MKTNLHSRSHSGSALLVTLTMTVILGTALASYLKLVQYQNSSVVRSQVWNSAMPLCEAGIEEALTHLNSIGNGNRAVNGWTAQGDQFYLTRTIGSGRYEVWINSSNQPTVTALGHATEAISQKEIKRTVLVNTTKYGSLMRGIIAKEGITMNGNCLIDSFDSEDPLYSTNFRYDAAKRKDLGFAGAINGNVNAGGTGVYGYVGTGPNGMAIGNVGDKVWMSTKTGIQPGHYSNDLNLNLPDVQPPFSGGGMSPLLNQTVTVTNYAYLQSQTTSTTYPSPEPASGVTTNLTSITTSTKPITWSGTLTTNTAVTTSTNYPADGTYIGNVTTRTVVTGKGSKAKSTTYYDFTVITGYTYDATTYTYNNTTTNSATSTSSYAYVTDSGNYQLSSLSISGNSEWLVRGDTVLYITGDFKMAGNSRITILPGASLRVYVGGSAALSGNGIMNLNQDATKFSLLGLPSCTSIALSGNAEFTGTIYAPNAALALNGSGNSIYDCVGAVVVKSAAFHGNFQFHYDEKLGRVDDRVRFKVAYWSEI